MSFVVVVVFNFFHRKSIEEKTLVDIDIEKVRKRISWRKKKNEKSHFSNAEIIRWPVQMPAFFNTHAYPGEMQEHLYPSSFLPGDVWPLKDLL